jgi:hypothetical protein
MVFGQKNNTKRHIIRVRVEKDIASFYGNQFPKSWMEGHEEFINQLDWPIGYDTLFASGEGDQPIGMGAVGKWSVKTEPAPGTL